MPESPPSGDYIHIPIRKESLFQKAMATITLSAAKGIKAVIGRLKSTKSKGKSQIQKYLFDKTKWTMPEAKQWAAAHERDANDIFEITEIRQAGILPEQSRIQVIESGEVRKITGYAAVWDQEAEIEGWFREEFKRGAFKKTLAEYDQLALWSHRTDQILGRVSAGTLRLKEDDYGLLAEIDMPDTTLGNDIYALVKRGDVDGFSIAFRAIQEEWIKPLVEKELAKRTVKEAHLREVSLVAEPAFTGTLVIDASGVRFACEPTDESDHVDHSEEAGSSEPDDTSANLAGDYWARAMDLDRQEAEDEL